MSMFFITGNQNKLREVQAVLSEAVQLDLDLPEIQETDPKKIIETKLQEALNHHSGPCIVEDTSLSLDCLNGLPGPLIKWFLQTIGVQGLADLAKRMGSDGAEACTWIGYAKNPKEIQYFEGRIKGRIVDPRGKTSFGWDPIFQPDGYERTFAEMDSVEKNKISMRRKALEALKKALEEEV